MGIYLSCKTEAKASLKLYNQISTYLFEQEYDELRNYPEEKLALICAKQALDKIIKDGRSQ